jgi:Asp-tRNA(Asn)/Glu-tRNA(Gln) amidotransferase A subunit family amidase
MQRRVFMNVLGSLGLGATLLPGALAALAQESKKVTLEMMQKAEEIAGLSFSEAERSEVLSRLNQNLKTYAELRSLPLENKTQLSLYFDPLPQGKVLEKQPNSIRLEHGPLNPPARIQDAAFYPLSRLARLIKQGNISSVQLTKMYLARMDKYNPLLNCAVTICHELALEQAAKADEELAKGNYKGPLHGIPYGLKDIFSAKGAPTTWGLKRYQYRMIAKDATVVQKLAQAGAVLLAKLAPGELATGDRYFKGRTLNPWNPRHGSGGSSAGPASAVAAGLVGFALGTETNGSIISPSLLCGVSGLRPSFGRVSRHGCMTIAPSYDKPGPMCRSAQDCALVLHAVCGSDQKDRSTKELGFAWDPKINLEQIRVGYVSRLFKRKIKHSWISQVLACHEKALSRLADMGAQIKELKGIDHAYLKRLVKASSLGMMVEAAAFHENLNQGQNSDDFEHSDWPARFRGARYVPGVEYVQANRARSLLIEETSRIMDKVDVLLGRLTLGGLLTNLTGHPELAIPHGLSDNHMPLGIVFTGGLYQESSLLGLAHRYQKETGYQLGHPSL